jgi:O-antigen ligase
LEKGLRTGLRLTPNWVRTAINGLGLCAFLFFPLLVIAPKGIAALLTVAGLLSLAARDGASFPWKGKAFSILFGVLLLWAALSTVWAVDRTFSVIETLRIGAMLILGTLLLDCTAVLGSPDRTRIKGLFLKGTLTALALLVPGTILLRTGAISTIVPFNQLALILAIGLGPLAASLQAAGRTRAALLLAAAMLIGILAQDSTTAKVSVFVGLAAGGLFSLKPKWIGLAAGIGCALLIATAPLTFPKLAGDAQVSAEMAEIKSSAWHRAQIWAFVGERIAERPLLGWGMNSSRVIPGGKRQIRPAVEILPLHPHNAALQLWLELGVPGAALFAAMSLLAWKRLGASNANRWLTAGRAAAMGATFISMVPGYGAWQEWWQASLWFLAFVTLLDDNRDPPIPESRPLA